MRKPRDFDSALRALTDKTKALKETKRRQLVVAEDASRRVWIEPNKDPAVVVFDQVKTFGPEKAL